MITVLGAADIAMRRGDQRGAAARSFPDTRHGDSSEVPGQRLNAEMQLPPNAAAK
ncbi:hypothetical protein [Burkholderia territorii]|uniref:hypothetical protein n=1 Tax=Burkholderia territorii TaxID=1503055 RepID=UPI0012D903B0|nr:hypothetical protein [Burkholderia territorii]